MKINRRFTSALVLVMLLAQWAQAANELRYHGTPGATVKACIKTGATRWNNSAFVAPSTISDGSWTTGMVSMTELSTSSSTATGEFVGSIPAGVLTAIGSTLTVLDIDYYESTPTPSTARDAAQSMMADSTGMVLPPKTGGTIGTITNGVTLATSEDVHLCDIQYTRDRSTPQDEYSVTFYKNGVRQTSGITSPTIQVIKRSDGSDLIAQTSLTQIGSTGSYKYDATTTKRLTPPAAALIVVTATVSGTAMTFSKIIGRDN